MNTPSQYKNARVLCAFIEKKYHKDLEANVAAYPVTGMFPSIKVFKGTFEENIDNLIQKLDSNFNVFFYVDPYGYKSLDFSRFQRIKNKGFNSVEMLINFNTFGFLREGCRLLKIQEDELMFTGFDYEIDENNDIDNMNSIANGDYWKDILNDYQEGRIKAHEAEERFIISYMNRFKTLFKHTINIPIKLKTKNMPKYRLVFGTNYPDGILLMADKMSKVWEEIVLKEREGQLSLFDFDYPGGFPSEEVISIIETELKLDGNYVELKSLLCLFIEKYGLPMAPRVVKGELKKMEQSGSIEVDRDPPFTPKTGKPTKSFDYDKYNIKVRIKP
jgi:three-Cys-motif partner protein